jgi:hypothetical protein
LETPISADEGTPMAADKSSCTKPLLASTRNSSAGIGVHLSAEIGVSNGLRITHNS